MTRAAVTPHRTSPTFVGRGSGASSSSSNNKATVWVKACVCVGGGARV